jgi:apolipoprotein N-acyltransferase
MSTRKILLYTVFSGILLSAGWYEWGSGLILLFALVPLLFVEDYFDENKDRLPASKIFLFGSITFLVWNILTTWWIYNATFAGLLMANLINTFLMALTFWLFHITKRKLGPLMGYFALIVFWLSFEKIYTDGEISWPWLTLGNGFAYNVRLIQWYEVTGVFGGTLWILLCNILIFTGIKRYLQYRQLKYVRGILLATILLILIPIGISLFRFYTYKEKKWPEKVVVIQPNVDPYEKFVAIPGLQQTRNLLNIASEYADSTVDYFVAPETSINDNIWLDQIHYVPDIQLVQQFLKKYPRAKFVVGITSYKKYNPGDTLTPTAMKLQGTPYYYDMFNSAIQLDSTGKIPVYHKSKLVVGVEKMPYPQYLKFLKKLTLHLGGTFRSNGTQKYRETFLSPQDSVRVAPVICYESVYGEYVTDYIKHAGANLIFVITNDGWWGNTPGYRQHNSLSSIRAIETRRSIARSANTGISSLIDQRGEVLQKLTWWKRGALKGALNANDKITFYVKHGDYLARLAKFFSVLVLLTLLVRIIIAGKEKRA